MRLFTLAASLSVVATLVACVPIDDADHVVFAHESEPNNVGAEANHLGGAGTYSFQGTCAPGEAADWFQVETTGGVLVGTLNVSLPDDEEEEPPFAADSAKFSVLDSTEQLMAEDGEVTPGNTAHITAPFSAASVAFVRIECPGTALDYFGSLEVP